MSWEFLFGWKKARKNSFCLVAILTSRMFGDIHLFLNSLLREDRRGEKNVLGFFLGLEKKSFCSVAILTIESYIWGHEFFLNSLLREKKYVLGFFVGLEKLSLIIEECCKKIYYQNM